MLVGCLHPCKHKRFTEHGTHVDLRFTSLEVWKRNTESGLWNFLSANVNTFVQLRNINERDKWKVENILRHWISLGVFGSSGVGAGNVEQSALDEAFDESKGGQHGSKGKVGQHKGEGKGISRAVDLQPRLGGRLVQAKGSVADDIPPAKAIPQQALAAPRRFLGIRRISLSTPPPRSRSPRRRLAHPPPQRSRSPRTRSPLRPHPPPHPPPPPPPTPPDWSRTPSTSPDRRSNGEKTAKGREEEEEEEDSIPGWCPNCHCWRRDCFKFGDWLCVHCGNHMYANKVACTNKRCPGRSIPTDGTESSGVGVSSSGSSSSRAAPLAAIAAGDAPTSYVPVGWCRGCAKPRTECYKPFDWACPLCGNHNWARKQARVPYPTASAP